MKIIFVNKTDLWTNFLIFFMILIRNQNFSPLLKYYKGLLNDHIHTGSATLKPQPCFYNYSVSFLRGRKLVPPSPPISFLARRICVVNFPILDSKPSLGIVKKKDGFIIPNDVAYFRIFALYHKNVKSPILFKLFSFNCSILNW